MSQKALVVPAIGAPMVSTERSIPQPKEGQLLIKISVSSLNPHDAKAQSYGLFIKDVVPSPLAVDIAGTVSALGPNVNGFSVGDRVFTFTNPMDPDQGGTQEYAVAPARFAAHVPKVINDDEATTLALNPLTAFWGMFREEGLGIPPPAPYYGHISGYDYSKHSILVVGGGSAVGKYAIQFAKYAGFGTIITTASKGKSEKELLEMGATHVLDRHGSESAIGSQVHKVVGDDLQYVYDAVNVGQDAALGANFLSTTKPGRLVVIAGGDFDASKVQGKKGGFERKMVFAGPMSNPELGESYWKELPKMIENGVVKPTPYQVMEGLDAEKVNEVLKAYMEGRPVVKPTIHIS